MKEFKDLMQQCYIFGLMGAGMYALINEYLPIEKIGGTYQIILYVIWVAISYFMFKNYRPQPEEDIAE